LLQGGREMLDRGIDLSRVQLGRAQLVADGRFEGR
jgi:hypothetical protein